MRHHRLLPSTRPLRAAKRSKGTERVNSTPEPCSRSAMASLKKALRFCTKLKNTAWGLSSLAVSMSYTLLWSENPVFRAVNACIGRFFLQLAGSNASLSRGCSLFSTSPLVPSSCWASSGRPVAFSSSEVSSTLISSLSVGIRTSPSSPRGRIMRLAIATPMAKIAIDSGSYPLLLCTTLRRQACKCNDACDDACDGLSAFTVGPGRASRRPGA